MTLVHSVDDEAVCGRGAHGPGFRRAAGPVIIRPYGVPVAAVAGSEVARALGASRTAVDGRPLPSRDVAAQVALARAIAAHGLSKALTFHHSVQAARRATRLEALPGWTWSPQAEGLDRGFAHLGRYRTREGHCHVPARHMEDGFALGAWVDNRRQDLRRGKLSADEIARFEAVPGWSWASWTDRNAENFMLLETHVARVGHARLPQQFWIGKVNLGTWADRKRQLYRKGALPAGEAARLEALPGWTWTPLAEVFEEGYRRLLEYVAREGHARVPRRHREGDFDLGVWVDIRRAAHRKGMLAREHAERLESLPGWSWAPKAGRFERAFTVLQGFVARERHARVPTGRAEDGFPLGAWCQKARSRHAEGKFGPERARRLQALPG